jgi:hypothetical protein
MNASDKPKLAVADLLAQAKPAERTIRLCLRGDLQAQWEQLDRDRAKAQGAASGDSLAGSPAVAIARQMETLRDEMEASTIVFTVRALTRKQFQGLKAAHPGRRDQKGDIVEDDRDQDVNTQTFWEPLIRACTVEPELDESQWRRLLDDVLSDQQYEALATAALVVCRGTVDIPFSRAALDLILRSGGELNAPNGSGSLSGGSTAGSPATDSTATTLGD